MKLHFEKRKKKSIHHFVVFSLIFVVVFFLYGLFVFFNFLFAFIDKLLNYYVSLLCMLLFVAYVMSLCAMYVRVYVSLCCVCQC